MLDQLNVRYYNLPAQLTPLIGRKQLVEAACALLQRPEVRILTLTGTGGVGKTRLGIQMATDLQDDYADGVCSVSLAPIRDSDLIVPTIIRVLGLKEIKDQPMLDLLKAYLQDKHLLLLLDNFEQVLMAAPRLSDLLADCPYLKILVTSRAVLHIRGEHEFPVPPLSLPDLTRLPESEALLDYASVSLFLNCAKAIKPDFQLTAANTHTIAEICVRLDGLPLAIELAAARIKLLPPQALLARLEHRLQVLTTGAQDVPARQQTLRNTLAWSYDLLDDKEQLLFSRLSVFVNGCTLEAVEALYSSLGDSPAYVLDGVSSLIDKSLLQQIKQDGEEPHLVMLETIREYGLECLVVSGGMEATRGAHATFYLWLAEKAEPELLGQRQVVWLERLRREHDNLRAALRWSLEKAENEEDQQRSRDGREMTLRLSGALWMFWWVRGHWSEGRNFLERALTDSAGASIAVRAKALFAAASLTFIQSDYVWAEALSEESLSLYRDLEDQQGIARSLYMLGTIAWAKGDTHTCRSLIEQTLEQCKEADNKDYVAYSLFSLGLLAYSQGEYSRACALFEESIAVFGEVENKRGVAHSLSQLAYALFASQGDQERVHTLIDECLALSREVGFKEGIAASYCLSGQLALSESDVERAYSLVEKSVELYRAMGHRHGTAESLSVLGKMAVARGDHTAAHRLYDESLAISEKLGEKWVIAVCLVRLGELVAAEGKFAWAAQFWGAAEAIRDAIGVPIPPVECGGYDQSVAAARAHLGEKIFASAWAKGQVLTPKQVLASKGREPILSPNATVASSPVYAGGLTTREVEVLRLVAGGLTDLQIADKLILSARTVHSHISSIYRKLGITSRSAATRYAIKHDLA